MDEGLQRPSAPSFEDVAAGICYEGWAVLVKHTDNQSFPVARLANRRFRDICDRHVSTLDLTIRPDRVQLWQKGQLSLARFHSLEAVNLNICVDDDSSGDAAAMLLAPFCSGQPGQEPPVWPRITSLMADVTHWNVPAALGLYRAVPQLVRQLPNLRKLDLLKFPNFEVLAFDAELEVSRSLYKAFGSLESLEVLRMSSLSYVRHLRFLRRLEELQVGSLECTLTPADMVGLHDLQHLKRLQVNYLADDYEIENGVMHLINSLPNLEEVRFELIASTAIGSSAVVNVYNCWFQRKLRPLAVWPTSQVPQGNQRLRLLHELTACFESFGVESLGMNEDMDEEDYSLLGRLLGRLDELHVGTLGEDYLLCLKHLPSLPIGFDPSKPAPAVETLPSLEPLASAAKVAEAALRRMQCGDLEEKKNGPVRDLLLQGSYLEALRELPGALLQPAMRFLGKKAAAANGGGEDVPNPLLAYQELPAAAGSSSLLLYCRGDQPGAVAAVVAAVEVVAAGRGPGFLRVVPLSRWAKDAFTMAVGWEVEALWGDEAERHRVGSMRWLRHLLGLWRQLNDFPPQLRLDE